jgi:hypothetical protein
MRSYLGTTIAFFLVAVALPAAGISKHNKIYGDYVEARTADVYTGPCFANSEVGLTGELAVFGWRVTSGSWDGVKLDGLSVVGVVRARHTLGDVYESAYPVKSVVIVDDKASPEQRLALVGFAKHMSGDLLQDVVRVDQQPISLTFEDGNVHSAQAVLTAGSLASIRTRAINKGDHICSNEEVWYRPLTKVDHAMPAFALAHSFKGDGLGAKWSSPDKRSSFVGTFVETSE